MNFKENTSIKVTKLFIIILGIIAVLMCVGGPYIVRIVMTKESPLLGDTARFWFMLIGGYICATILFAFLYLLYKLVKRIESGQVFVTENVKTLNTLSNLVLTVCILTLILGITCTYMIFIITVATAFVTPIIRVVKNAFGKAVEMQDELDYTV
jgi:hypothetical protein